MEDSNYKPLDPDTIRLPPPAPPTDRLLEAVKAFYMPPGHFSPRDRYIFKNVHNLKIHQKSTCKQVK